MNFFIKFSLLLFSGLFIGYSKTKFPFPSYSAFLNCILNNLITFFTLKAKIKQKRNDDCRTLRLNRYFDIDALIKPVNRG